MQAGHPISSSDNEASVETVNAKRRRILEETRDVDADEDVSSTESSDDERLLLL